ncbi:MAG: hypothetical protein QOE90_515 [Thermoplasmata archaeon]|nr:hypothetical protein [Thermoplasmata archaeon]
MAASASEVLLSHAIALEEAKLPFMIVGAFAVMAHGLPRTSGDLDIVVHLPFEHRDRVRAILEKLGGTGIEERRDEWGKRIVADTPSGLEVEVFFTPPNVVYDREYARRRAVPVTGRAIPFISPEDLVLRKLVNTRLRRGLDYDDAVGVLRVQGEAIDLAYLRAHCVLYRVCDLLERAIQDAAASG